MKRRYGYCCINLTLQSTKDKTTTNRGMVKKTFLEKGLPYVSEVSLKNLYDLKKIIEWNSENGISMYRASSDIFPWNSEYSLTDLPDYKEIVTILEQCGEIARSTNQRITFHPSHYSVLASEREDVVRSAIKELDLHSEIFDIMGFDKNHFYPINIHVSTTKPTKEESSSRFCRNFEKLSDSTKCRLVVEVDDKKSQFTSLDLHDMIYKRIGVPITFDYLHNKCNTPDISEEESLKLCLSTWPEGIMPLTHYSDSRKIHEDSSSKDVAHSDWIWNDPETYGMDFDIEFEVKQKDLALLKYIREKNEKH
jgi:UV DNA damage endonuclease